MLHSFPQKSAAARSLALVLFVASGFSGLVYEVVWVRSLTTVFGVSAYAISTVLASFMGGLALGSFLSGRYIDRHPRPLVVYGVLEAAIGAYALAVPLLFRLAGEALRAIHQLSPAGGPGAGVARVALSFAILAVPTTMMGATLPVLCKYFIESLDRVGRETGRLYFFNTAGAVAGCAMAGFLLVPRIGLHATTLVAAAVNGLIAAAALLLHRIAPFEPRNGGAASAPPAGDGSGPRWRLDARTWIIAAYALSGFSALVFEVMWSRILILVFGSTVYSFSAMLSVFLAGLAVGGVLFARLADRTARPPFAFAALLVAIAFVILGEVALLEQLPSWFLILLHRGGVTDASLMLVKFVLSAAVLLPAAVLFGGTFPLVSRICTDSLPRAGERIGTLYAMNTLGAVVGSLAGGFVLLPLLGTRSSLVAIALLALAVGSATLLVRFRDGKRYVKSAIVAVAIFAGAAAILPPADPILLAAGVWFNPSYFAGRGPSAGLAPVLRQTRNLYYAEGVNDTVIVNETPTKRSLSLSGKIVATSSGEDIEALQLLGHLPALLHPGTPKRAINIGLGVGGTVSALASHPLDVVEVAELEPKVIEAVRFFSDANHDVLKNPRVKVILADGRNLLSRSAGTYDIISSDPNDMYMTGVTNLYSLEFFELAHSRLAPRGVMSQWIDVPELAPGDFRSVIATFAKVFPHFTVWFAGRSVNLIGSDAPIVFDLDVLRARIESSPVREELLALGIGSPEGVVSLLVGDEESFRPLTRGVEISTDDRPFVEYNSARKIFERPGAATLRLIAEHYVSDAGLLSRLPGRAREEYGEAILDRAHSKRIGILAIADLMAGRPAQDVIAPLTRALDGARDPFLAFWLAEAHQNLGDAAQKAGDLAAARRNYEIAHRIEPDRLVSLMNLAYVLYLERRYDDARPLIERAYAIAPRVPEVAFRLGLVRDALGETEAAAKLYEEAATGNPDSPTILAVYASLERRRGRLVEAEALFRKALSSDPGRKEIREALAGTLLAEGKLDDAERECNGLLEGGVPSADCSLYRGIVRLSRGRLADAEMDLLAARAKDAERPEVNFQLARLWGQAGRKDDALVALDEAIARGGEPFRARAERDPVLAQLLRRPAAR